MAQIDIRDEILRDIQGLPSEKLADLQNYVQNLKKDKGNSRLSEMMRFAGSWSEMSETEYQSFVQEIIQRRQDKGRARGEASAD